MVRRILKAFYERACMRILKKENMQNKVGIAYKITLTTSIITLHTQV